jgi:hypothetical protein
MNRSNSQSSFINRARAIIRCCSYCKIQGHNITQCNDRRLLVFQENLINRRNELLEIYSIDFSNKISYFETWLYSNDQNLIKAYAIRYCGSCLRHTLQICVTKIINYIWDAQNNILGNYLNENNYIQFPSLDESPNISYDFLSELILISIQEHTIENRKFNIKPILCSLNEKECNDSEECNICYEVIKNYDMTSLNCNHRFCGNCMSQLLKKCDRSKVPCCAMCRTEINYIKINNDKLLNIISENIV